jgi:hypothetical protein
MAYLFAIIIGAIPWIALFLLRKDLRREMLIMSLFAMPAGLFDIFFVPNYWAPITLFNIPVGIEGLIFTFEIGGIAAVLYAELTKQIPVKISGYHKHVSLTLVFVLVAIIFLALINHVASTMLALYAALLAGTSITIFLRKDLLKSAIEGALAFGLIYFILFFIELFFFPSVRSWFTLTGLPRIFVLNVPIWEIFFAVMFAAYWGNFYEIIFGYKYKKSLKRNRT